MVEREIREYDLSLGTLVGSNKAALEQYIVENLFGEFDVLGNIEYRLIGAVNDHTARIEVSADVDTD